MHARGLLFWSFGIRKQLLSASLTANKRLSCMRSKPYRKEYPLGAYSVPTPRDFVNVKTVFARRKTDITRAQRCSLALLDLYTALVFFKVVACGSQLTVYSVFSKHCRGGIERFSVTGSDSACYLNVVPRVLSLPTSRKYPGHVSMYTNQIRTGGGSLT